MLPARLAHEQRRSCGGGRVAGEEAVEVDERDVELGRVGAGALAMGPYELGWYVELVLQHCCIEN